MNQRVYLAASPAWRDRPALVDWIKRLPKGSEVLYRPFEYPDGVEDPDGLDVLGEMIEAGGALAASLPGDPYRLPDERLDAVLIFAQGPNYFEELALAVDCLKRRVRSSLIPARAR